MYWELIAFLLARMKWIRACGY